MKNHKWAIIKKLKNLFQMKQVLKQADYDKLLVIIDRLEDADEISVKEVMELTGKSRTTAWRYIQLLVDSKILEVMGNTNKSVYKKII